MIKPNDIVKYNGVDITIGELSKIDPGMAKELGYGHFNPWNREVISSRFTHIEYPFTPDTCEYAGAAPQEQRQLSLNAWVEIGEDEYLICKGCGLDAT